MPTAPENEFRDVAHLTPSVSRRWVNVSSGGHISAVTWGTGAPALALLHRRPGQARDLDAVAIALDRPVAVLDLPGSGRSSGPAGSPRQTRMVLSEALWSFAPRASVLAGIGDGGLAALAALPRIRGDLPVLVLVDGLPDAGSAEEEQLRTAGTGVEVVRAVGGAVRDADVDRLLGLRPDTRVATLDVPAAELETTGAEALARTLRDIADRAAATAASFPLP
ncbi:MAG TPA: alpha/beta hydrolase [Acidimicrobiales bacterium]|nr:alpha/beta hydrolase [Acidimicrobiales bacterium]